MLFFTLVVYALLNMDALTFHRKARLQALIDGKPWEGNQAQFAVAAGVTKARITQLLDPTDSFGERAAKNIADKLNLPDRFFEAGFTGATTKAEQALIPLLEHFNLRAVPLVKKDAAKIPEWLKRAHGDGTTYIPDLLVYGPENTEVYVACLSRNFSEWFEAACDLARRHPGEFVVVDMTYGLGDAAAKVKEAFAGIPPAPPPKELPPSSVPGQVLDEFVAVRRADVSFSNGHGKVEYSDDERPPLVFRADFLRRMGIAVGNAVVVEAEGSSNEPKIPDGAVVLINRGDRERLNGDLFAFRVDGELLIKRLERIDGVGILATAENPNFKPKQKVYTNPPDFEVIGKAVWTGALL